MGDARQWLLGIVHAGQDLLHPLAQRPFVFVEPADAFALPGVLPLGMLTEFHVAPHRHEIHQIFGQQLQPFLEPPLIQQIGFLVRKSSISSRS